MLYGVGAADPVSLFAATAVLGASRYWRVTAGTLGHSRGSSGRAASDIVGLVAELPRFDHFNICGLNQDSIIRASGSSRIPLRHLIASFQVMVHVNGESIFKQLE